MGARSFARNALRTAGVPHLNLSSRPRLQRLSYEEPIEVGASPRFIVSPTATTTQKPKLAEKIVTLPGDAEQSTKRPRQEIPREQSQPASSSSCATADTSVQTDTETCTSIVSRRARREHSETSEPSGGKHGVDDSRATQRKRNRILDRRSEGTKHRKTERAFQHGLVWCGGSGRQAAITKSFSRHAAHKNSG